jgi:cytochrome c553
MIKVVSLQFAVPLAILTIVLSATGYADGADSAASRPEFEAKMGYCQDCHGPSGQGYRGFFPMPRLAGQQPEYLENQLRAFVEHRRTNNIMASVAHVLSPAMISALATSFRDRNPPPLGGAPKELVATGRQIFQTGIPDGNIAACAACHGPDAQGSEQVPRLAGQLYPYVVQELTNWSKERGQIPGRPDISGVMAPVARSLSRPQIEAVAAYLSALK